MEAEHTEPVRTWARTVMASAGLCEDERAVAIVFDRLRQAFDKDLTERHLIVVGEVRAHCKDDLMRDQVRLVVEANVVRDLAWLAGVWAEAERAVAEDQRWIREQRRRD